jgi:hypothetical protein
MKKIIYASAFSASLFLISCGGSEAKKETEGTTSTETSSTDRPSTALTKDADWELKDLGGQNKTLVFPAFAVKLPKDAMIEKDTTGMENVQFVTFKNGYKLMISYYESMAQPELKLKGQIASTRAVDIDGNMGTNDVKVLLEDANGYAYTTQVKRDGKPEGPISGHFAYFIEDKKGGFVSIHDFPTAGLTYDEEAEVYSEANTKKIREFIAGSAAFK